MTATALTQQETAALRASAMFSRLDERALAELVGACGIKNVPAGRTIFRQGQKAEQFFVVLSGSVKVYRLSPSGDEHILHVMGPGNCFAEAAMWESQDYPAHAETVEDCRLLAVSRKSLELAVSRRPAVAVGMLRGMSGKLREFASAIESLSLKEVHQRLAGVLIRQARQAGANTFQLAGTKRTLAAQLGTVPETLSRAFARLKKDHLIEVKGKTVKILDQATLADMAE